MLPAMQLDRIGIYALSIILNMFHKLFDLNARDYYNVDNPVVKILLPKMNYGKEERIKVIRQAYKKIKYSIC
ncbi:MAG: hypothetical protein LC660_07520 [Desulfobacteraceae bacterium]|nr:hypothetical protein [Desulfobacteraceae bacterium]